MPVKRLMHCIGHFVFQRLVRVLSVVNILPAPDLSGVTAKTPFSVFHSPFPPVRSDNSHSHSSLSRLARIFHGLTGNLLNNIVFHGLSDGLAAR